MFREIAPATFALLLLAGCASGPDVKVDADPSANFAGYRTYSWAYHDTPRGMNPLTYQRVRQSIDANLASRGYTQADPGDFAVGFTLGARDKVEVTDFGPYGPFYPGYGRRGFYGGWGMPYSNVDVRNVTEGTLTIDIYDTGTKRPVWHGVATQEIGSKVTEDQIDTAVSSVLAKFGPGTPAKAPN